LTTSNPTNKRLGHRQDIVSLLESAANPSGVFSLPRPVRQKKRKKEKG
jgi:hypothetical protein